MYWTEESPGEIVKAYLDGSKVTKIIVAGLRQPRGIAVDQNSSRLFWTDCDAEKVQSSDLEGFNVTTIIYYDVGATCPWGIATDAGVIYWTNGFTKTIESSGQSGNVSTLYNNRLDMGHITLATAAVSPPKTRRRKRL